MRELTWCTEIVTLLKARGSGVTRAMVFALRFVTIFHANACEEETNILKFGLRRMKWVDTECREAFSFINQFGVLVLGLKLKFSVLVLGLKL